MPSLALTLDPRTLLVVLFISNCLMAAIIRLGVARQFREGLSQWTAGLLVQAVAWALFDDRLALPEWLSFPSANALLALGWSLQAGAILEFQGRRRPVPLYWAPALGNLILFGPAAADLRFLLGFSGFGYSLAEAGLGVLILSRAGGASLRTRGLMAATYFFVAVVNLARGALAVVSPDAFASIVSPHLAQAATLGTVFVAVIVASFAFLLMHIERADEHIRRLATTDPLTGVYNRRTFMELAAREIARGRRSGQPVSLLLLDLDFFKRVNDSHGHLVGDAVLVTFAQLVQKCLRRADLLVRYGGEEFCVLLPGVDRDGALVLAERIRQLIAQTPIAIDGGTISITVSCGATTISPDTDIGLDTALACADDALYEAKESGRNRTCFRLPGEPRRAAAR